MLENSNYISTIGRWYELERTADFFEEFVAAIGCLLKQINFVCDANARDVWALVTHLTIPVSQIGVSDFSCHVEDHDAYVSAKVVGGM